MKIIESNYTWGKPLRSIGIWGTALVSSSGNKQLSFLDDGVKVDRMIRLESIIDRLRERFGQPVRSVLCHLRTSH